MTRPGPHRSDPRREPLDPAERELAGRLARLGPHGEPPAAIDARILAAAHAATQAAPRRSRRLPLAVGVAASLVLALGLAWQLRPLLDAPPPPVESQALDIAAPAPGSQAAAPATGPEPARSAARGDGAEQQAGAPPADRQHAPAAVADEAEQPARGARTTTEPQAFPAPTSPRPPRPAAPPAPPPPAPPPAPVAPASAPPAPAPIAGTGAKAADAGSHRQAAESRRSFDQGRDATPGAMQESAAPAGQPASADAQAQLRQAQLERIRTLRDRGDAARAREELEAFLARWPGYPLPEDLQALRR